MAIKLLKNLVLKIPLLLFVIINSCKKQFVCSKSGLEFIYLNPGVSYSPGMDSIPLGSEITLEASAPKTFYESVKQYYVTLNEEMIIGPFTVSKESGNLLIPTVYAIDDIILSTNIGKILKDSVQYTQEQLKGFRTVHWYNDADSFKLKFTIKPKVRGVFFLGLGQQGNKDGDCALYKYFLKVKNNDQHLYFLSRLYGGFLDENSQNYAYCFKVF